MRFEVSGVRGIPPITPRGMHAGWFMRTQSMHRACYPWWTRSARINRCHSSSSSSSCASACAAACAAASDRCANWHTHTPCPHHASFAGMSTYMQEQRGVHAAGATQRMRRRAHVLQHAEGGRTCECERAGSTMHLQNARTPTPTRPRELCARKGPVARYACIKYTHILCVRA